MAFVLVSTLAALAAFTTANSLPTQVDLPYGRLVGTTTSLPSATASINKFLGVPFAKTPPGRFLPPSPADQVDGEIDATSWKPSCIQQFAGPGQAAWDIFNLTLNEPPPEESEDCLYLNIYAPSTPPPPGGRAVLFWIYGGGLRFGTAGLPAYDGSAFAAYQDVILISPNYRLNVFGFPNSPELAPEGQNLGFLDQRFALQWTQDHIDKFGGDPAKVTIFGESAGSLSADTLITSFDTETAPFRASILESGQASYGSAEAFLGVAGTAFEDLASQLNCAADQSDLECVRQADAFEIRQVVNDNPLNFVPFTDNITSFGNGAVRRQAGNFARVPILSGTNSEEGRLFVGNQTSFSAVVEQFFAAAPDQIPLVEAAYGPVGTTTGVDTDFDLIAKLLTEYGFQCTQALQANQTAAQGVPAWNYIYNASFPSTDYFDGSGATHTTEIVQVFQTYSGGPINPLTPKPQGLLRSNLPPTAQQHALSSYMNSVWANFAKNPEGGPGWTRIGGEFEESLGVFGNEGSSGVTVVDPETVNSRCELFYPLYGAAPGGAPGL